MGALSFYKALFKGSLSFSKALFKGSLKMIQFGQQNMIPPRLNACPNRKKNSRLLW